MRPKLLLLPLVLIGCQEELVTPAPTLDGVDPQLVCNDQLTTPVTITGTNLSPLPIDLLEEKPSLVLPELLLDRVSELDGSDAAGAADVFDYVTWTDAQTMTLSVEPLVLETGVFDLEVVNPDGRTDSLGAALAVAPPPTASAVTANLECVEQAPQPITIDGTGFLQVGSVLPAVNVGPLTVDGEGVDDCFELAGPVAGQSCNVVNTTLPQGSLDPAVHLVSVTNPETAACVSMEPLELEIVPRPTLSDVIPRLECVAQADQVFDLVGTDFLLLADGSLPTVTLGSFSAVADSASGCEPLAGPAGGERCTDLVFTLPAGAEQPGIHDVIVTNPAPAECFSTDPQQVELVPPPSLSSIEANLECLEQQDQVVTLTGQDFIVLEDGTLPTVQVGTYVAFADSAQGCLPLYGPAGGQTCTELTLTLPVGAEAPGVHAVTITNPAPADCTSVELVEIEVVPRPMLTEIEPTRDPSDDPAGTCLEQGSRGFDLLGMDFVVLADGTPPTVQVGGFTVAPADVTGVNCVALSGPAGGEACDTLQILLPQDAQPPGVSDVVVINPDPAECTTTEAVTLEAFTTPVLASVSQPFFCGDQPSTTLTLTGSDFVVVGGVYPTVHIGNFSTEADGGTCVPLTGSVGEQVCTDLTVTVLAGDLGVGTLPVSVENPIPLGCTSTAPIDVDVIGAPEVVTLTPPDSCDISSPVSLTAQGSGFIDIGGQIPTVTLDGVPLAPVTLADCNTPLTGPVAGTSCDTLLVDIPADTVSSTGLYDLVITNPAPVDCSTTEVFVFAEPPTISYIDPPQVCYSPKNSFDVDIFGVGFSPTATAYVDGVPYPTTWIDDTHIVVTIPGGVLQPGLYDILVDNGYGGGNCVDIVVDVLEITEIPIVFFVDPPIVPNVIPVTATAFVSGINGTVTNVDIEEVATGVVTSVPFRWNPAEPAVVEFDLAANLTEGFYDIVVTDATGCVPVLEDAFFVEADTELLLTDVVPGFGWTDDFTAVTLSGTGTPPFEDPPRVYLSPVVPGPTTTATELRAVTWVDGGTLDAVVPDGLSEDTYNVVVVNPNSGEVGLLPSGFQVLSDQPPYIDTLAPATVPTQDTPVIIQGGGFGDPLVDPPPQVDLECYDPSGDNCNNGTGNGSFSQFQDLPVLSWGSDFVEVEVPGGAVGGGICVLTLSRNNGTFTTFSALSVTNPAQNLYDWRQAEPMNTARAGTLATTGEVTRTSKYVYALGGENSTDGVLDSVERSRVDPFGNLGPWSLAPESSLPTPVRDAAMVRVGRFLYVLGGHDGTAEVADVWRAQILDPLAAPQFTSNLSIAIEPTGLPQGTQIYRVSALFDAADDDNPGGESMASDPFVVRLPDLAPDNIQVTLQWSEVPGAIGYRIYRSAGVSGQEEFLVDLLNGQSATTWTDVGNPTDPYGVRPLPVGALGNWSAMPPLPVPLEAPCAAWGEDPSDPSRAYVYIAGGNDGANARDEIAYLPVTLVDDYDQDAGAWTLSANSLQTARWSCKGLQVTSEGNLGVSPGDTWIYFVSGEDQSGSLPVSDAGLVTPGGELGTFTADGGANTSAMGVAQASDFIYAFGGANAGPNPGADSVKICSGETQGGCGGNVAPFLANWNAAGVAMCESRYRLGSTVASSVIFAVGGETGSGATRTVDFTNF